MPADSRERTPHSARLLNMARGNLLRLLSGTAAVALFCAGCGASGRSSGPKVPDVAGQQAAQALDGLRRSGYERFSMVARWSTKPVGVVLATNPSAGSVNATGDQVLLVVSTGTPSPGARNITVPGIGQCSFAIDPYNSKGFPCIGGTVLVPRRAEMLAKRHRMDLRSPGHARAAVRWADLSMSVRPGAPMRLSPKHSLMLSVRQHEDDRASTQ
jgi:hypothetical protein